MSYNYNNYDANNYGANSYQNPYAQSQAIAQQTGILQQVYLWMMGGLLLTGAAAIFTVQSPFMLNLIYGSRWIFFVLLFAELGLVWTISATIGRMSSSTATALFILYALLNGLTFSIFFLAYTSGSIAATFFITGGMFGAISLYGYMTKRDLTNIGAFLLMALIGLILASIVNFFLHSPALYWLLTYAGIAIFVGLTAYDTQKIKRMIAATNPADRQNVQRLAIIGALTLYLDFINLFLLLLRIFGRRR